MTTSANSDGQREAEPDPRRELLRGGGRRDEQREDEQHAGDLRGRGDREAEHEQERDLEQRAPGRRARARPSSSTEL